MSARADELHCEDNIGLWTASSDIGEHRLEQLSVEVVFDTRTPLHRGFGYGTNTS
jgi:hypothetical protein